MPLELPLKLSLGAATGVELFAGVSLVLAPERFVRKTYGGTAPVDALTVKYARTSGVALSCLGLLSGLCLVTDDAPLPTLATLTVYNVGAALNNAATPGGQGVAALHAALGAALAFGAVSQHRRGK